MISHWAYLNTALIQNTPFFLICCQLSHDRAMQFSFCNYCQTFIYNLNVSWKDEDKRYEKKPTPKHTKPQTEKISFYSANQHILHNYKVVRDAANQYIDIYLPSTL